MKSNAYVTVHHRGDRASDRAAHSRRQTVSQSSAQSFVDNPMSYYLLTAATNGDLDAVLNMLNGVSEAPIDVNYRDSVSEYLNF